MNIVELSSKQISNTEFGEFWAIWPKKVARFDAQKAWNKLTAAEKRAAVEALPNHISQWDDPRYIPHPATWLNGRRFEDELECSLQVALCAWRGCQKTTKAKYCDGHVAALKRGETPN